jgi:hypothetical protein
MGRLSWPALVAVVVVSLLVGVAPNIGIAAQGIPAEVSSTTESPDTPALSAVTLLDLKEARWWSLCNLSVGLRRDNIDWSISGDRHGENPNILSELEFSSVESYQIQLQNRTMLADLIYLRAAVGYAGIMSGTVRDSDYNADDRRDEYSRSISKTKGDGMWDATLGAGYSFYFDGRNWMIAPMIGVAYHRQNIRITDGRQVRTEPGGYPLGPIDGLDSTYQSQWQGPWLGFDLRYRIHRPGVRMPQMELGLFVQGHWNTRFYAEADWNLRSDFEHPKSFEQEATGRGICLEGEWVIKVTPRWDFSFSANYQRWQTNSGTQRYFLSDGDTATTHLNAVNWESYGLMVSLAYRFF